jgi:hypothetical protein
MCEALSSNSNSSFTKRKRKRGRKERRKEKIRPGRKEVSWRPFPEVAKTL